MIIKGRIQSGIWYTDDDGNVYPSTNEVAAPPGATYAHVKFPLQIREDIYRLDSEGSYKGDAKVLTTCTSLGRDSGRLAVAMVNSGDYDLSDALAVLDQACERCLNVLWDKYVPGEGYPEGSEEWKACGTVCDFCREYGRSRNEGIEQGACVEDYQGDPRQDNET